MLCIIVANSCELTSTKEFDVPFEGKKLVAIGFVGADKGVEVFVSSTVPTINGKQDSLKDIAVNLFENNLLVSALKRDSGIFKTPANFKIQENKTYRIDVKAADYGPLSTNDLKLPLPTKIDSIDWQFKDKYREEILLKTVFKDAVGKNYYAIKIEKYYGDTLLRENTDYDFRFLNPSDVVSDELFDTKLAKISRVVYVNDNKHKINRLKIRLYSLDEGAYLFFKTLDNQDFVKGEFFLEPQKVSSNIKGGYGVWGGYSFSTMEIKW
jgi:Domain of unknown function (DUF4249)